MTVLSSLPERPLTEAEVSILNRSEPVTLAVAVEIDDESADGDDDVVDGTDDGDTADAEDTDDGDTADAEDTDGDTRGILLATDDWVRGLAFVDGAWQAVVTDEYDDSDDRYDALQECESAVRSALAA